MRIVAGEFRGRTVEAPQGDATRPTTDRVREALFSSLYSLRGGFEGAVVLDAFAGSGALGLEALSRGAEKAVFFERDAKAAKICEGNARSLGLGADRATCVRQDVFQAHPAGRGMAFDLIFLDPPYAYDVHDVMGLLKELGECGAAAEGAIVAYEHAHTMRKEAAEAAEAAGFEVMASKKYGKTGVTLLRLA